MRKKLQLLAGGLIISLTVATLLKMMLNTSRFGGPTVPTSSSQEAEKEEVLICRGWIEPNEVSLRKGTITLGEVWIEEAFEREYYLAWWAYNRRLGHYFLCLQITGGNDLLTDPDTPHFRTLDGAASFARQFRSTGSITLWRRLPNPQDGLREISIMTLSGEGDRPKLRLILPLEPAR